MPDSRLFRILYYLLDKGSATAPELAAKFEVSPRTVYRDVEALSGAGIPVYTEPGRNGGIYLLDNFVLDRAVLSDDERREVLTAIQGMSAPGYVSGGEALAKLSALFNMDMEDWLEVDFSRWGNHPWDNSKFELLKTAIISHREIKIVYESIKNEKSERVVQPLKLSYKSKEWYLKAFCLERQDFRLFKLNRILELEISEKTFAPRLYPSQEDSPGPECPRIVLLFSKETAYRVYDEFDIREIECRENGDLQVSTEMPVDPWLVGYLLSFGAQVEVAEPEYLKEALAEQARKIDRKSVV